MEAVRKPPYAAGSINSKKILRCRMRSSGLMKKLKAPIIARMAAPTKKGSHRMGKEIIHIMDSLKFACDYGFFKG